MGTASPYLRDNLFSHVFRNVTYTSPPNVYMSLWTGDPTVNGTGPEVTGGGYARKLVPPGTWTYLTFLGLDSWYPTTQIFFGPSTASWGAVSYYGLHDALTGGNFLFYGAFYTTISVVASQTVVIAAGSPAVLLRFR